MSGAKNFADGRSPSAFLRKAASVAPDDARGSKFVDDTTTWYNSR